MTKYDLLDVLGSLDEKYLQEAEQRAKALDDFDEEDEIMSNIEMTKNEKTKKFPVYFGATIAAGLALIVGASFFFGNRFNSGLTTPGSTSAGAPVEQVTKPNENSAPDVTVPAIVTDATATSTLTSVTTIGNENSYPDYALTDITHTVDPSLITTGPESNQHTQVNLFGGKGDIRIELHENPFSFGDKDHLYIPQIHRQYFLDDLTTENHILKGDKMKETSLGARAEMVSDGTFLYAYDFSMANKMLYTLSNDSTQWVDFKEVPFANENTLISAMYRYEGGTLFIFQSAMNLDMNTCHFAYVLTSAGEWKQINMSGSSTENYGFGSWHFYNDRLVICRKVDFQKDSLYDFVYYDLRSSNPTQPDKRVQNVDVSYVDSGSIAGHGSFVGYNNNEWCVDENGEIYFKSMEEKNGALNLYHVATELTDDNVLLGKREKVCSGIGHIIYYADSKFYTNPTVKNADGSVNCMFVRYDSTFSQPENLLKNARISDVSYVDGSFLLTLTTAWENGTNDYLSYGVSDEDLYLNGHFSDLDVQPTDCMFMMEGLELDGNTVHNSFPELCRKRG